MKSRSNVKSRCSNIFANVSPSVFVEGDLPDHLGALCAILNSRAFWLLMRLSSAAAVFQVGMIQKTPVPLLTEEVKQQLSKLTFTCFELLRERDGIQEDTHAFRVPLIAVRHANSLQLASQASQPEYEAIQTRLLELQIEIDAVVAGLYNLSKDEFTQLAVESTRFGDADDTDVSEADQDSDGVIEEEEEIQSASDIATNIQNLLMWCLGCAFGRWDVRFALDPSLLPKLQGPFDPLPRCSPGMLLGSDALPATPGNIVGEAWLRARPNVITLPEPSTLGASPSTIPDSAYPLRIDWDGIIPDDDGHPDDIVRRAQDVLELLWGDRAEAIEHEACQILGVASLRDYFRQPKAFFDFHIKRYSKSRRKAPIYWLLQSAKKNYGLWLYYHRLDSDTLFKALTLYADPKLNIERTRLEDLQRALTPGLPARDRRALEKTIARQESVISELTDFRNELERIARLGLAPDFNDGVIISIAPLHPLVPWKEAAKMWAELVAGKYSWSTMSQRMRQKGLAKGVGD